MDCSVSEKRHFLFLCHTFICYDFVLLFNFRSPNVRPKGQNQDTGLLNEIAKGEKGGKQCIL